MTGPSGALTDAGLRAALVAAGHPAVTGGPVPGLDRAVRADPVGLPGAGYAPSPVE